MGRVYVTGTERRRAKKGFFVNNCPDGLEAFFSVTLVVEFLFLSRRGEQLWREGRWRSKIKTHEAQDDNGRAVVGTSMVTAPYGSRCHTEDLRMANHEDLEPWKKEMSYTIDLPGCSAEEMRSPGTGCVTVPRGLFFVLLFNNIRGWTT